MKSRCDRFINHPSLNSTIVLLIKISSIGRDGLTHNMLNDIHNNWKKVEAVRIKCLGVPTLDMQNVCAQLEVYICFFSSCMYVLI